MLNSRLTNIAFYVYVSMCVLNKVKCCTISFNPCLINLCPKTLYHLYLFCWKTLFGTVRYTMLPHEPTLQAVQTRIHQRTFGFLDKNWFY